MPIFWGYKGYPMDKVNNKKIGIKKILIPIALFTAVLQLTIVIIELTSKLLSN